LAQAFGSSSSKQVHTTLVGQVYLKDEAPENGTGW